MTSSRRLCAILFGLSLAATNAPAQAAAPAAPADTTVRADSLDAIDRPLREALTLIQREYLEPMTRPQLVERTLRALLRDLDPYSRYLDRQEWQEFDNTLSAHYAGLGVDLEIDAERGLPRVRHLLVGSVAGPAGIRPGDLFTAIDGRSLQGLTMDPVLDLLIGAPDTEIRVTVDHQDGRPPVTLTLRRRTIQMPSVRGFTRDAAGQPVYLYDAARGIGYVRISHMAEDTAPEVERALAGLRRRRMKGLVLDLRSSSGGLMRSAIGVADLLLERGLILRDVSRRDTTSYEAHPGGCVDVPMVVLIDSLTASSSEFLAAALKDNHRAQFVGRRTFGKARIQRKLGLDEGGGLVLTTGRFERPSGRALDRHEMASGADSAGVAPDPGLMCSITGREFDAWAEDAVFQDRPLIPTVDDPAPPPDRMLERAVQVLVETMRRKASSGAQ